MGKSRRSRGKGGQRSDPISKPVKPPSDPELAALREKSILPVLKDLQSSDPKSRTTAAGAIANIIQDTKCRKLLLREQIVHTVLSETLTDSSVESRAAGWYILKVLVAEEEADFCVHLYRLDVLTAIQHASAKIAEALRAQNQAFTKLPQAEQNFIWGIAESCVTILAALAESQDEALDAISKNDAIISFLFTLIAVDFTPAHVLTSTLSCIMTLSEDNVRFVEAILADRQNNCYKQITAYKMADGIKSVLACGILHNVFAAMNWHDQNPGKDGACDGALVPVLSQALGQAQSARSTATGEDAANLTETLQVALEILASIGTSLQETLEKGNKGGDAWEGIADDKEEDAMDADNDDIADNDDNVSEKGEGAEEDEDDEMDPDEMEADMDMVTGADDNDDEEKSGLDDLPTLKELMQKAIPQIITVTQQTITTDETSMMICGHAFGALNNIAWTVSCIDFAQGENTDILRAWDPVACGIWKEAIVPVLASDTSDVELATMVTSLAWAVARTLHHSPASSSLLNGTEHNKFISLYHASRSLNNKPEPTEGGDGQQDDSSEDPFQGLGVKCIGVLGQLALDPAPIALNREVGVFLMTILSGLPDETPPADAVEALNQIFDIYGDETKPCDKEVFWKDGFMPHLEGMVPKAKAMVKKVDKRRSQELRSRADEAVLNLGRFLAYKKKHGPEGKQ